MTISNMPDKFEHVVETIIGGSIWFALTVMSAVAMGLVLYSLFK